jgi:hypothetical protein
MARRMAKQLHTMPVDPMLPKSPTRVGAARRVERRYRRQAKARAKARLGGEPPLPQQNPFSDGDHLSHLSRLIKHAKVHMKKPSADPPEAAKPPQPLSSWRNPRSACYAKPAIRWLHCVCKAMRMVGLTLCLLLVITMIVMPAMAGPTALQATQHVTSSVGMVNYQAAEVQLQEREMLDRLRQLPYNPRELAEQFKHGINAHLPDGVATKVSADRYTKDEVCGLIIDHIPGVSEEQHAQLLKMLREKAPSCVAYSLDDLEGYQGAEPPLQVVLDTTQKIIMPPRRNWSAAESSIIDEKCQALLEGKYPTCVKLVESDYACNPVLAMKRSPMGHGQISASVSISFLLTSIQRLICIRRSGQIPCLTK